MHQEASEAFQLLNQPQQFKKLRSDSGIFLHKLADDSPFIKDLLDICFRPQHFQRTRHLTLTPAMPATIIEALTSLYQQFISLLANGRIVQRKMELEGIQNEGEETQKVEQGQQFKLLLHLHAAFGDQQGDDASISYLSRILGPLYYNYPSAIMLFYETHEREKLLFFSSLHRRDVMDIFCKMLEAECGKQFFTSNKCSHLNSLYSLIKQKVKADNYQKWLQALLLMHKFVIQKIEQKFDRNKYKVLLQTMASGDLEVLVQSIDRLHSFSHEMVLACMRLCEEVVKEDGWVWNATQLRVQISHLHRRNSMSNNFYEEEQNPQSQVFHLPEASFSLITQLLIKIQDRIMVHKAPLQNISYFRTLYFWVKVLTGAKSNGHKTQQYLESIINQKLLKNTFVVIKNHPHSTPLHNYIKEFILESLVHNLIPLQYFLLADNPFLTTIRDWLPRRERSRSIPFGPQCYHIFTYILKIRPDLPADLTLLLTEQQGRRQRLIGGYDPKRMHQNLQSSYNAFSQSSEQIIELDVPSFGSIGQQSFVMSPVAIQIGNSIKFGHLASIEKNFIGQGVREDQKDKES